MPTTDLPALKDLAAEGVGILRSPDLPELEIELGRDLIGAFRGERCEALAPLVQERLRSDPSSLLASVLDFVCLPAETTFIGFQDAKTNLRLKMREAELSAGEYFGDTVVATSSMLDVPAYMFIAGKRVVGDYFEVAGGGRRLYYVAIVRELADRADGSEATVRFDLSAATVASLRSAAQDASSEDREVIEDSPAAVLLAGMAALPDAEPAALIGKAIYTANQPGNSWLMPEVIELLSRAAEQDDAYGRVRLARVLLLDHDDPSAYTQAYEHLLAASKSGLGEADLVLHAMYEKGLGTRKDARSAREAMARLVAARGRAHAEYLLSQLYRVRGSALHDDVLGKRWLEKAARGADPRAQNEMGVECMAVAEGAAQVGCMPWYRKAMAQGLAVAALNLAINHENGSGVPRDLQKAEALYRQAMDAGLMSAASNLGYMLEKARETPEVQVRATALYRVAAVWGAPWGQNNYGVSLREGKGVEKDEARAVRWFRLAAVQGNPNALIGLAGAYEWGNGVERDAVKAAGFYRYAMTKNNTGAMLRLAVMYLEGRGVDKDPQACRELLTRAAGLGDSDAMWRLGDAATDGTFLDRDKAVAEQWLRRSAEAGNVIGKRMLGYLLSESSVSEEQAEAVGWLRQAAAAGDGSAMNTLGYVLQNGIGATKDLQEARAWYLKGADAGEMYAIYNLAQLARDGIGEPRDLTKAAGLFEKASGLGLGMATCQLGNMLVAGEGVAADPDRGWKLVQQAADAGQSLCQLRTGLAYRYGAASIKSDMPTSVRYLQMAAAQGLDEATAQLAEISMHENEDDAEKIRDGRATLARLADADSTRAQFLLAEACVLGRPWPRDMVCARHNFERAANGGFPAARSNLGLLFQAGLGGEADLDAAEAWYRQAVAIGALQSRYELGRLLLHRNKNIPEAIELLLASAAEQNPGAIYVLARHCREHPDCPVASPQQEEFRKRLDTLDANAKNALAWGLAVDTMSDVDDARYAIRLVKSLPAKIRNRWTVVDTLAAAYARAGEFEQAVAQQRRAIAAMPATEKRVQRKVLEERLALYETGKTFDFPY